MKRTIDQPFAMCFLRNEGETSMALRGQVVPVERLDIALEQARFLVARGLTMRVEIWRGRQRVGVVDSSTAQQGQDGCALMH